MLRLSVVIPVYNVEDYLEKCINSVIAPGVKSLSNGLKPEYEIIIVDDGATDSSPQIADRFAVQYPGLIRVIHTENGGLGSARNVGIEASNAEYLYFLDSDDYLVDGAMQTILDSLNQGYDICIFDTIAVNIDGKELKYMPGCSKTEQLSLQEFPELLLQAPHAWNKIYRRTLYTDNNIRYPSKVWFEDICTVLKLYCFTDKIAYMPLPLHRYLQRKGSILNSGNAVRNIEIIPAMDEIVSFYLKQGRSEELKHILEYLVFHSQFLTASVRVNLADYRHPVQEELMLDFLSKFPDYRLNPYVKAMGRQHKLLDFLFRHKLRLCVHLLMAANNKLKNKQI